MTRAIDLRGGCPVCTHTLEKSYRRAEYDPAVWLVTLECATNARHYRSTFTLGRDS